MKSGTYYERNRAKVLASRRAYYRKNKAKINARCLRWRRRNADRWKAYLAAYQKVWKRKHAAKCRAYVERWMKRHPERWRQMQRRYSARARAELSDSYVRHLLGITAAQAKTCPTLVEAMRVQLQIHRALKKQ